MKRLNRCCAVCGHPYGDVLHHQKFQLSDKSILPDAYDVVCCDHCHFVFADTAADQQIYNRYYAEYSKYEDANSVVSTGGGTSKWDKQRLEATAADIRNFCPPEASILDIGCANGGLLLALKHIGYQQLSGLDPSKSCVNYVNQHGLACYVGELFDGQEYLHGRKFDFIILSHVLEHIYDIRNAVLILKTLLTERGQLYIETPDAGHYSEHYVVPYYYFDPEHINHFDRHSLMNVFGSAGFECIKIESKLLPANESLEYPAVFGIFRKVSDPKPYILSINGEVRTEIEKYIRMSRDNSTVHVLQRLADSQEPIVVFGAGNFTARLLDSTPLRNCNILFFVDNDKKKQGTTLNHAMIRDPDYVRTFKGPIVICSALHHDQIVTQLTRDMGASNELYVIS